MTDYARPIGPRWYGCLPDEVECMTCGRIRLKTETKRLMGEGWNGDWIECIDRDENGECAQADADRVAH